MLIPLLAVVVISCTREAVPLGGDTAIMDTVQEPNPHRLPFSRDEYVAAQSLVRSRAEAEEQANRLFTRDPEVIGITVMDGDYVLVALVSAELAERMIAARPRIADLIRLARANREEVLRTYRAGTGS